LEAFTGGNRIASGTAEVARTGKPVTNAKMQGYRLPVLDF
jgi:hypothetical protein